MRSPGKGVHIVTVNDYLASRDAAWMGKIYGFLGMTVGTILSQMPHEEKHAAYAADITYGTNNEFGFDYLRDNMAMRVEDRFQRGLHYAIVDEVDSILIDEARTPLIISGQAEDRTDVYLKMDAVAPLAQASGNRGRARRFLGRREEPYSPALRGGSRACRESAGARWLAAGGREPVRAGARQPESSLVPSAARA